MDKRLEKIIKLVEKENDRNHTEHVKFDEIPNFFIGMVFEDYKLKDLWGLINNKDFKDVFGSILSIKHYFKFDTSTNYKLLEIFKNLLAHIMYLRGIERYAVERGNFKHIKVFELETGYTEDGKIKKELKTILSFHKSWRTHHRYETPTEYIFEYLRTKEGEVEYYNGHVSSFKSFGGLLCDIQGEKNYLEKIIKKNKNSCETKEATLYEIRYVSY